MGYRTLRECVRDLEVAGHLVRVTEEVNANLEIAEIHRRVYRSNGPALFFERVKNCRFPMVSNLFGTIQRAEYLFRDTLPSVRKVMELAADPRRAMQNPLRYWRAPFAALHMLPKKVRRGAVMRSSCQLADLPQLRSWPRDGGGFITLPLVYSENVDQPGLLKSNLGM